tara:strand:+ start:10860 stop:11048 length:189 start_codon:yes stop_codon:yes gene_type:complete
MRKKRGGSAADAAGGGGRAGSERNKSGPAFTASARTKSQVSRRDILQPARVLVCMSCKALAD